jgi:hypothetical protein
MQQGDEGSVKWMEGKVKSTEANKPDVFIMREMPNR